MRFLILNYDPNVQNTDVHFHLSNFAIFIFSQLIQLYIYIYIYSFQKLKICAFDLKIQYRVLRKLLFSVFPIRPVDNLMNCHLRAIFFRSNIHYGSGWDFMFRKNSRCISYSISKILRGHSKGLWHYRSISFTVATYQYQ